MFDQCASFHCDENTDKELKFRMQPQFHRRVSSLLKMVVRITDV